MEKYTVLELKKMAKDAGIIGYSKLKKAELILALDAKTCLSSPKKNVDQVARLLNISTTNKTKTNLCNDIASPKRVSPPKRSSSPKRVSPPKRSSSPKRVSPPKRSSSPKRVSPPKQMEWVNLVKQLTGTPQTLTPKQLSAKVTKVSLDNETKKRGLKRYKSKIDAATALFDAVNVNGLEKSLERDIKDERQYNRQSSEREVPAMEVGISATNIEDPWLDFVDRLTNTQNATMTPEQLLKLVGKNVLIKEARNMGISVEKKKGIELANDIYAKITTCVSDVLTPAIALAVVEDEPVHVQQAVLDSLTEVNQELEETNQNVAAVVESVMEESLIDRNVDPTVAARVATDIAEAVAPVHNIRDVETIERMLKEVMQPDTKLSDLALVQKRVAQYLGL